MFQNFYLMFGFLCFCAFVTTVDAFGFFKSASSSSSSNDLTDVSTLKLVQVIFRHGDRTPIRPGYPNDPYRHSKYWPEGWGQLTKKGVQMEYELGAYLSRRYSGFLNKTYTKGEVYARSSDTDRTIMSLQATLAGLYPPSFDDAWNNLIKWQPIPFRTIPTEMDNLLFYGRPCPRYIQLYEQVKKSKFATDLDEESQNLYGYMSEHTGITKVDSDVVAAVFDTLFIENLRNYQLPEWTKKVFPDKLKYHAVLKFCFITQTEEMRKLAGGSLLGNLMRNMEFAIHPPNVSPKSYHKAKLQLYSGHDSTIVAILAALGIYDRKHIPPYASAVLVELHKGKVQNSLEQEYFVRIYYRNETDSQPREFFIPNCRAEGSVVGVCTFEKFKNVLSPMLIKDWDNECQVGQLDDSDGRLGFYDRLTMITGVVFFGLVILLGGVVVAIGTLSIFMIVQQWRRNARRKAHLESMFSISRNSGPEEHMRI